MPRNFSMSWEGSPAFRWVKMFKGVRHRISCEELGLPRAYWTQDGSYQQANEWWERKKVELDPADPLTDAYRATVGSVSIEQMTKVIEQAQVYRAVLRAGPDAFPGTEDTVQPDVVDEIIGIGPLEPERRIELLGSLGEKVGNAAPTKFSMKHHADMLVEDDRTRVAGGDIKPETYGEVQTYLSKIVERLGADTDARTVNEGTVRDFNHWLKRSSYVPTTKQKIWRIFLRFVRYLFTHRLIELPRNVTDPKFKFVVHPQEIQRFDLDDVKAFLADLKPRQKLYALLGLNCGMLGVDIANLTKKELDLKKGRITRKRTKTGERSEKVPVVSYRLWPETIRLLKANISNHPTLALTSMANTPLWDSYIGEDGKRKKKDLVSQQWNGQLWKVKDEDGKRKGTKPRYKLKNFRSIGATIIGDHRTYAGAVSHYLGHSPVSIVDRHYKAPSIELFDEIMTYVGGAMGFRCN